MILHIAAGGENERIADYVEEHFGGIPKGLLPVPGAAATLAGRIVSDGLDYFDQVIIHTSKRTYPTYKRAFLELDSVDVRASSPASFLSTVHDILRNEDRVYLATADYYAEVSWRKFVEFHASQELPVSCVATRSPPLDLATIVQVQNGRVTKWKMGEAVQPNSYVNSGMFILDNHPTVLKVLDEFLPEKDLYVEVELTRLRLLACLTIDEFGWNVNDQEAYLSMHTYLESA